MCSDLKKYLEAHLEKITGDLGLDALAIYAIDYEKEIAYLLRSIGGETRKEVAFGVTPLGECARSGEGSLVVKTHTRDKYRSQAILPIPGITGPVGVLMGASLKENFFTKSETSGLKALAFHLGKIFIRN